MTAHPSVIPEPWALIERPLQHLDSKRDSKDIDMPSISKTETTRAVMDRAYSRSK